MEVTIHVSESAARVLRSGLAATPEAEEILRTAREQGVALEPQHPATEIPLLIGDFTVNVPDPKTAEAVAQAFLRCKGVEGAYCKPPGEPPESQP